MLLAVSLIVNFVSIVIFVSLRKEYGNKVKVVYEDKIVKEIVYKDKIVYKDRIVYKDKIVVAKPIKEKGIVKQEEPQFDPSFSPKKIEILKELFTLESKKKKSKQDLDNIYTLKMVLPNIK